MTKVQTLSTGGVESFYSLLHTPKTALTIVSTMLSTAVDNFFENHLSTGYLRTCGNSASPHKLSLPAFLSFHSPGYSEDWKVIHRWSISQGVDPNRFHCPVFIVTRRSITVSNPCGNSDRARPRLGVGTCPSKSVQAGNTPSHQWLMPRL